MRLSTTTNKNKIIRGGLSALFWLAVWQIACLLVAKELLLPAPAVVFRRFGALIVSAAFWQATLMTFLRIFGGFFLGVAGGLFLAVVTKLSKTADTLFNPLIKAVRATPIVSFIILTLVWLSKDTVPVFIVFLMVVPIVWDNVRTGIDSRDQRLIEMAFVFKLKPRLVFTKIYVPTVTPYFLTACTTSLGLAWKSGIAAEVISRPEFAMGSKLSDAKVYLETPDVFVWSIVVIVLSLAIENLMVKLFRSVGKRFKAV